jgi:phage terminase small subunit
MSLNAKQKLFCELYVLSEDRSIKENGTAAYSVAYPESARTSASARANDLLKKNEIKAYITQLRDEKRLKQIEAIQQIERENLELAKLYLNNAKLMGEFAYSAFRNARKEKIVNGKTQIVYELSDRSVMAKTQAARASVDMAKAANELLATLHGLPEIEDWIIKSKEKGDLENGTRD